MRNFSFNIFPWGVLCIQNNSLLSIFQEVSQSWKNIVSIGNIFLFLYGTGYYRQPIKCQLIQKTFPTDFTECKLWRSIPNGFHKYINPKKRKKTPYTLHKKWSFPLRISSVNVRNHLLEKSLMENFNFLCSHISAVDIIHLAQRRTYDD